MSSFKRHWLGAPYPLLPSDLSFNSHTLDATTDALEFIFQAQEAATITRLGYRLTSVTGAQPTYIIALEGVSTAGNPDGTVKGGGSPASATFVPSGSNTWNWVTLANSYTCTRGEMLAITIKYSSGTIGGSNNVSLSYGGNISQGVYGMPYAITNNAGSRTRSVLRPLFGYGTASTVYGAPCQNQTFTNLSSNTTPDEHALRFSIPADQVSTYQVGGVRISLSTPIAAKTILMRLYDGTTALQDFTWDTDIVRDNAQPRTATLYFDEVTLSTLSGGSAYRIGFAPQETGADFGLHTLVMAAAADLDAYPGQQDWFLSTRTDAGAWTDVTATRPSVELLIADWTAPSGGIAKRAGVGGGLVS